MSKAFVRVWHAGLLHRLEAAEVLKWFKSYLPDSLQRMVLPGVSSFWNYIRAGVPQGFILGPLLFLFFINDIGNGIDSNIRLFADVTCLFIIVEKAPYAATCLHLDYDKTTRWVGFLLSTHLKQRHSYSQENKILCNTHLFICRMYKSRK